MNAKQIWQTALERFQAKVPPAVFTTWFQGTSAISFQDGIFVVRVPTTFARSHLHGRFRNWIQTILVDITGSPVEVQFEVANNDTLAAPSAGDTPAEELLSGKEQPHRTARARHAGLSGQPGVQPAGKEQPHPLPIAMTSSAVSTPRRAARRGPESDGQGQIAPEDEEGNGAIYTMEPLALMADQERFPVQSPVKSALSEGLLNPRYTFNTFIVGKSNKLAHAASLAVAENPGRTYNPLFLYGGVGLGKTHLLHAVGHAGEAAGLNVLYVTSEKFTNEIINAIRYQKTEEFRMKYRQIDILLVDDIQFIAGKESTEEEFFHTFNTLHSANKQIIVTSDRPPKAIHSLQDRLRSRFEWGLLADVQPPEYEHRLAILRSKTESLRFDVPAAVTEYIARPECKSVRELEGALNRVMAYATLQQAPLTVGLAVQALEHIYTNSKPLSDLTAVEVLEGVCRYYNIDPALVRGKQRDREIVWPRQVAMYLMREETSASLLQIGTELGGRDHTTIMHGWEKVQHEIAHSDRIRHEIAAVLESLQQ